MIEVQAGSYTVDGEYYDMGSSGVEVVLDGPSLRISPNPFSHETTFCFDGVAANGIRFQIYDVRGRLVNTLSAAAPGAGASHASPFAVSWDGESITGESVSPGIYFVRIDGAPESTPRKVVRR